MERLFLQILEMSLTATVAIMAVLALRLLLRRVPRIFSYLLWVVVLFRLLCPLAVKTPLSFVRWTNPMFHSMLQDFGLDIEEKTSDEVKGQHVKANGQYQEGAVTGQGSKPGAMKGWTTGSGQGLLYGAAGQAGGSGLLNGAAGQPGTVGLPMNPEGQGITGLPVYREDGSGMPADQGGSIGNYADQNGNGEILAAQADVTGRGDLGGVGGRFFGQEWEAQQIERLLYGAGLVWFCGLLAMALYGMNSSIRFRRTLAGALRDVESYGVEVYRSKLPTAFVYGIVRPRIYLPIGLSASEEESILLHERIHVKRGDHLWRLLGFAALAVHWFNPLVWLAFIVSGRDMEMSCDEAVLRKLGRERTKEYSDSLLALATGRYVLRGAPLAFGEGDTGSRIRNALRYKRPTKGVNVMAALLCIAATLVLTTDPVEADSALLEEIGEEGKAETVGEEAEKVSMGETTGSGETEVEGSKAANNGEKAGEKAGRRTREPGSLPALEVKYADIDPEILLSWRTLEWEGEIFKAEEDGIYHTANGKTERIFEGYVSILPNMTVYDRRLFFFVDTESTSKEDFIFYNDIRWVDLDDPEITGLVASEEMNYWLVYYREHLLEEERIVNFHISDSGYLTTWNGLGEGQEMLLPISAKGYRLQNLEVMDDEQKMAYGQEISDWMLENPGTVRNVSMRTSEETYSWLDMDRDGSVERVTLKKADSEESEYSISISDGQKISVEKLEIWEYGDNLTNNLLAICPDGETILIAFYAEGPSGDPVTLFYCYEDGKLQKAGEIHSDVRECRIDEKGVIWAWERADHVQTDWADYPYRFNEEHRIVRIQRESYRLLGKQPDREEVRLIADLPLYDAPNGKIDRKLLQDGAVFFDRISYDPKGNCWVCVQGLQGEGWIRIPDEEGVEVVQNAAQIFSNLAICD